MSPVKHLTSTSAPKTPYSASLEGSQEANEAVLETYHHLKPPPSPSPHPSPQLASLKNTDRGCASYFDIERHEAVHDSYHPRQCDFKLDKQIVDEKIITHDHVVARHYERQSVDKGAAIFHREMGDLQLLASLTNVQYGFWGNENACLVGLRFQFLGGSSRWRFEKAEVEVRFANDPKGMCGLKSTASVRG